MDKLLENIMMQAARNNPKMMNMLAELNKSGLTPKEFFYKKTSEMGIDPEEILKQLKL